MTLNVAQRGHANIIELLVSHACIDDQDGKPLVEAAENGNDFAVRFLLEH